MRNAKQEHSGRKPMHMKSIKNWRVLLIATIITAISMTLWITYISKHTNEAELQRTLQTKIDALNHQTTTSQQLEAEKQKLKQELEAAQKALQAKKAKQTVYAATLPQKPATGPVNGCGDNEYAHYIYMKESGCRTTAVNSIGCRGIGQACPGSKLPCGDDYACQNAWFTNYAIQRYGSWYNAYVFWTNNHWW